VMTDENSDTGCIDRFDDLLTLVDRRGQRLFNEKMDAMSGACDSDIAMLGRRAGVDDSLGLRLRQHLSVIGEERDFVAFDETRLAVGPRTYRDELEFGIRLDQFKVLPADGAKSNKGDSNA
jgi:hypothetical protein